MGGWVDLGGGEETSPSLPAENVSASPPAVAVVVGADPALPSSLPVFVVEDPSLVALLPLTLRDDDREGSALFRLRPNQWGNPCRKLNPPGGRRPSSVALTVSVSEEPVVNVYVVSGTIRG